MADRPRAGSTRQVATRDGTANSARAREAGSESFLAVRPLGPEPIPEVVQEDRKRKQASQANLSILDIQKENKKLETLIQEMQKRRDKSQSSPG